MTRIRLIPLHRKGGVAAHALVDAADYEWLSQWKWNLKPKGDSGYAVRYESVGTRTRNVYLHRELLGLSDGDPRQGDHINRDKLDNRRANLRVATDALNKQNVSSKGGSSRYRGVAWHKKHGKWRAQVVLDGKVHHLGLFDDEDEAGRVAAEWRATHMPYACDPSATVSEGDGEWWERPAAIASWLREGQEHVVQTIVEDGSVVPAIAETLERLAAPSPPVELTVEERAVLIERIAQALFDGKEAIWSALTVSDRMARERKRAAIAIDTFLAAVSEGAEAKLPEIPRDFWREVPCGHPQDPVAAWTKDGPVCHCGHGLKGVTVVMDPEAAAEAGAPGPVVLCEKCGCHPAIPPHPSEGADEGSDR